MGQKDIEKFAFLFLCGERDRNILLGKEKMTYADLDRLTYLTDFFGLEKYNLEIWNQYGGQFKNSLRYCADYTRNLAILSPMMNQSGMTICMRNGFWIFTMMHQMSTRKITFKILSDRFVMTME